MKHLLIAALAATFINSFQASAHTASPGTISDTLKKSSFREGILYTRISFPGNLMNEALSKIDFEKGDVVEQLKRFQASTNNEGYSKRLQESMASMTTEEKSSMGMMMMAAMMSPLYAKIYCTPKQVLAKAYALNYTLESYMHTGDSLGRMVAISNDNSKNASIKFSASNLKKVWEKNEVDSENYHLNFLTGTETVSGMQCKKGIYTYKAKGSGSSNPMQMAPPSKLIVWYTDEISSNINFLHPFYFQLDKAILKIEVHYDLKGKNKMLYEVTSVKPQRLVANDFIVSDAGTVVDYDLEPMKASMDMLAVFMSGGSSSE